MGAAFKFPDSKAIVFWPVGTGDTTTVILKPGELVMQIDLRHLEKADDPDEPEWPIIDHLVKLLPKKDGKPYLAVFALTHPDKDHVQGFAELLEKVQIGELWHTPKIFRCLVDGESLCDDAKAFRKEAHRRRKAILKDPLKIGSGDRLLVIGHDEILKEDGYNELPSSCKITPGKKISRIDGEDMPDDFQAFIHGPFKDEQEGDKNDTSLSLNIVLWEGDKCLQLFLFGDRAYPALKRIFEVTQGSEENEGYLHWELMLCPHHCSKKAMYWKEEGDDEEVLKKDILDLFGRYMHKEVGFIISSSHSSFTDGEGDNPPHKRARSQYEKLVRTGCFLCTHEYPDKKAPEPIVFAFDANGLCFDDKRKKGLGPSGLAGAIASARGCSSPPKGQVGFGDP